MVDEPSFTRQSQSLHPACNRDNAAPPIAAHCHNARLLAPRLVAKLPPFCELFFGSRQEQNALAESRCSSGGGVGDGSGGWRVDILG